MRTKHVSSADFLLFRRSWECNIFCFYLFFVINTLLPFKFIIKNKMPFWLGLDHRTIILSTYALTTGVAIYSTIRLLQERRAKRKDNVYESDKLLSEYLVFHYGSPDECLRYDFGPKSSLDFPKRCAELCLKHFRPDVSIST